MDQSDQTLSNKNKTDYILTESETMINNERSFTLDLESYLKTRTSSDH